MEHPKDKYLAERTVEFAFTWIPTVVRDRKLFSVEDAQAVAAGKLKELNSRPLKMWEGNDGTSSIVQEQFMMNPGEKNVLFLFCGTRLDRIKGLVYEGDEYLLRYKRLSAGRFAGLGTSRKH